MSQVGKQRSTQTNADYNYIIVLPMLFEVGYLRLCYEDTVIAAVSVGEG